MKSLIHAWASNLRSLGASTPNHRAVLTGEREGGVFGFFQNNLNGTKTIERVQNRFRPIQDTNFSYLILRKLLRLSGDPDFMTFLDFLGPKSHPRWSFNFTKNVLQTCLSPAFTEGHRALNASV